MNETGPGELCILIADAVKKIRNKLKFSTDLLPEPFLSWVHVSDRRICKFYGESCKIQKYSRIGKTRKNETFLFVAIGNKEYN